jgi:large subunit ribosomal protein L4
MEILLYNKDGRKAGAIQAPERVFGLPWNAALVQQVVTAERANARTGIAHAKDRSEVSGGGKKPWRQKGTGRARHGSTRSPIWVGGGVTHGPRSERTYAQKINKRMRSKALFVSLSEKARDGEIIMIEDMQFPEARTRHAARLFRALSAEGVERIADKGGSTLVATGPTNAETVRALRNIPYVKFCEARNLTTAQVLAVKYIVFPKTALPALETRAK